MGGDTRGGLLWHPLTGQAEVALSGSQSSRKCAVHFEIAALALTMTEGHVAAAAAVIQRFVAASPPSAAAALTRSLAPRARGLGASLAVALQQVAVRSSRAAERFNWFRLLQAGKLREDRKNKAQGTTTVIGLELDVSLHVKHASLALDWERVGRAPGTDGVSALRLSVDELCLQGNASKSCLTARLRLGAVAMHGACGSDHVAQTALLESGRVGGGDGACLCVDLEVVDAAAVQGAKEPHIRVKGHLSKVGAQLPGDAVTNACRWLTRSTSAVLAQPSLAAAARGVFEHSDSAVASQGAQRSNYCTTSKALTQAKDGIARPDKVDSVFGSVLLLDLTAEGVEAMLPKDSAGGSLGIEFAIGKMQLRVSADVRSQTEAPVGEAEIAYVRCTMKQSDAASWQLIDLGGAGDDVAARYGSRVVGCLQRVRHVLC